MIRSWFRRQLRRLERWLAPGFDQVREFIYLDEVSVRSLLASTGEGGIPSERMDKGVRTSRVGGTGGMEIPTGGGTSGIKATGERKVTKSVKQVQNYDLIQSKFTKLHNSDSVQKRLSLKQVPYDGASSKSFSELAVCDLERGDILELRVNVSANLLFRLYQTVDYFADIAEEEIDSETEEVLEIIETSLGNSIPIIGEAINYRVVKTDDGRVIKRVSDISEGNLESDRVQHLRIVSLLDIDDMWVDPIQTLLSDDEFVMYCRVEDVGIDSWYPLKVTRAISSLSPSAAEALHQNFREGLDEAKEQLSEVQDLTDWSNLSVSRWVQDIERYTDRMESEYDIDVPQPHRRELLGKAISRVDLSLEDSETAQRKEVLDEYTDFVIAEFDLESINQEDRLQMREAALSMAKESKSSEEFQDGGAFRIEAKTVALYW